MTQILGIIIMNTKFIKRAIVNNEYLNDILYKYKLYACTIVHNAMYAC